MMPGPGLLDHRQVDSGCQPLLTLPQNRFSLQSKDLSAQATLAPLARTLTDNRR